MSKIIDLQNKDFGYWHVIEQAESRQGRAYWKCQCTNCGKIKEVSGAHLRGGRTTNCGCIRAEKMRQAVIKQEAGKTYGFLKVEREATKEEKPRQDRTGVYWNCTCTNCGRKNVIIFGDYLRKGQTISCGCITSKNESKIAKMLDTLNIKYIQQYSFKDLLNDKNYKLFFDFAIVNNNKIIYVIEFDGIQHFQSGLFHSSLKDTHNNDIIKNHYCFEHNIPIIRIPYNKYYTLNDLKLEYSNFLLTPENEEQYYIENT